MKYIKTQTRNFRLQREEENKHECGFADENYERTNSRLRCLALDFYISRRFSTVNS